MDMLVFVFNISSVLSLPTLRERLVCTVFILKPQPRCWPLIHLSNCSRYWLLHKHNWFTHVDCSFSAHLHRLYHLIRSGCLSRWFKLCKKLVGPSLIIMEAVRPKKTKAKTIVKSKVSQPNSRLPLFMVVRKTVIWYFLDSSRFQNSIAWHVLKPYRIDLVC